MKPSEEQYQSLIQIIDRKKIKLTDSFKADVPLTAGWVYGKTFKIFPEKRYFVIPMVPWGHPLNYRIFQYRPLLKREAAFYLDIKTRGLKLLELPFFQASVEAKKIEEELKNQVRKYLLAPSITVSFQRILESQSEYMAHLQVLKMFYAIQIFKEKTGKYPEKLNELVPVLKQIPPDPFTGNDFVYKKQKNGFIIYSLGPNLKDDIVWQFKE